MTFYLFVYCFRQKLLTAGNNEASIFFNNTLAKIVGCFYICFHCSFIPFLIIQTQQVCVNNLFYKKQIACFCMRLCVCVYETDRERERERDSRGWERERGRSRSSGSTEILSCLQRKRREVRRIMYVHNYLLSYLWNKSSSDRLMGRVFTNGLGDLGSIPGRVIPKTLKMVLDTSLLNTQQYKVLIKGKVEPSKEMSSSLPIHLGVVAVEKGAVWSPSTTAAKNNKQQQVWSDRWELNSGVMITLLKSNHTWQYKYG